MSILGRKKQPKLNQIAHIISWFAIIARLTSPKSLRLLHFPIFLHEIFRIGEELNFALNLQFRLLI